MESNSVLEAFIFINDKFKVRPLKLIADGDSSTYKTLVDNITEWGSRIRKIECCNHLMKNFRSNLEDKKKIYKLASLCNDKFIQRACKFARKLLTRKSNNCITDDLFCKSISNICSHLCNDHTNCDTDNLICIPDKIIHEINPFSEAILLDLDAGGGRIAAKVDRIYNGLTSNLAEAYHAVRCKFDGGKFRNLVQKGNFEIRSYCAALQFNLETMWPLSLIDKLKIYQSDNHIYNLCSFISKSTKSKENNEKRKSLIIYKQNRIQSKYNKTMNSHDPFYGPSSLDINDSHIIQNRQNLIESLCNYYIANYSLNKDGAIKIENLTQSQTDNPEWYVERKKRITASNIGLIIRQRSSTVPTNTVLYLLRSNDKSTVAMRYGKETETLAKSAVKEKFTDFNFIESGLRIDPHLPYLGASPDGLLINKISGMIEAVIEIKCPLKGKSSKVHNICLEHKQFCCYLDEKQNISLKKNHIYYSQIQCQMALSFN